MRSNYKQLGEYIQVVDNRNKQLEVKTLLGVSVKKIFIPSIANTVGTDFKKYKIVKRSQFTYIPDTSRRGDKIGLAMLDDHDIALVSQAYTVFEITNHEELDPEYLIMWFRRPEFDRYARFKSHGSVREIFDWDEMCKVELPIPSIEKQREIVKEYNTIVNRIKLNEQLNQKLEETAQAIYKHWFVDFEFPDENGEPYKSSGGEMVWNEELGEEIPVGWKADFFGEIIEIKSGKTPIDKYEKKEINHVFPLYGAGGLMGFTSSYIFDEKLISIGRVGTHGVVQRINTPCWPSDNTLVITSNYYEYVYQLLLLINYDELNRGGVQGLITKTDLKYLKILNPNKGEMELFEDISKTVFTIVQNKKIDLELLKNLKSLFLAKMSKVKTEL